MGRPSRPGGQLGRARGGGGGVLLFLLFSVLSFPFLFIFPLIAEHIKDKATHLSNNDYDFLVFICFQLKLLSSQVLPAKYTSTSSARPHPYFQLFKSIFFFGSRHCNL